MTGRRGAVMLVAERPPHPDPSSWGAKCSATRSLLERRSLLARHPLWVQSSSGFTPRETRTRVHERKTRMSERIDDIAKTVATRTTRRSALLGLGALALGALGIFGLGQETEAKN